MRRDKAQQFVANVVAAVLSSLTQFSVILSNDHRPSSFDMACRELASDVAENLG